MLYRLERIIEPCIGLGYTQYTKHLAEKKIMEDCFNWDTKVGDPLQSLECPIAMKRWTIGANCMPATYKHHRPHHLRDPLLRETALKYCKNNEHQYLFFGCQTIEQLNVWFPEPIQELMINEFGFGLKKYVAKLMWHGLRQSMMDYRTVMRHYSI